MNFLYRMWNEDEGQDLVEYALIAGLIAVAATASIIAAGTSVTTIWTAIQGALATAAGAV